MSASPARPAAPQPPTDVVRDGLEAFAPYVMNRILRRYNAAMDQQVRDQGLTVARLRVLAALAAEGPQTVNDLAVFSLAEQSSTSRLVDQMTEDGLVQRQVSPDDSRLRIVSLTALGQQRFAETFPTMAAAETDMMADLSQGERLILLELLRKVLHTVRRSPI